MLHSRKDYERFQDPENKIPKDEPVFILRAQDPLFVEMLEWYAHITLASGGSTDMARAVGDHAKLGAAWPKRKTHSDL